MKLFYYDPTGSRASLIAAYIHLNKLPYNKTPSITEIIQIEAFDQNSRKSYGIPSRMGVDEQGNEIYAIGFGKDPELALQVIFYLLKEHSLNDWRFYNVQSRTNLLMKFSGFFLHKLKSSCKLRYLEKYLAAREIHKHYLEIGKLVKKVKEWTD